MTIRKFYGCENDCSDAVVNDESYKASAAAFFADDSGIKLEGDQGQSLDDANNVFFGVEQPKRGISLGTPIPGYSGTNQRVEADNIFGMTYANAKTFADGSN